MIPFGTVYKADYDTSKDTRTRKVVRSIGVSDRPIAMAGKSLREQARYLDENYDIAHGILTALVNNTVGPSGISVEPQPRNKDGTINEELAEQLIELYDDWSKKPEVTWEYDRPAMERLAMRSLIRDGEFFAQHLSGPIPTLRHGTTVPYSIEMLEADMVPYELAEPQDYVHLGIKKNSWNQPVAYKIYKRHPGSIVALAGDLEVKDVNASRIMHVKLTKRINQTRGVTAFAPVIGRIFDIKDVCESERVAARISAAMAFQIKKGTADAYVPPDPDAEEEERVFEIAPGIVFDNLAMGEEVSDITPSRPNPLLEPFMRTMFRAAAAGTDTGASTISREYAGSYSSQRQELVEQNVNYTTMTALLVSRFCMPSRNQFIDVAVARNLIQIPGSLNQATLYDAEFKGPPMVWIDPKKEIEAKEMAVRARFKSTSQVIREDRSNPNTVFAEIARERKVMEDLDILPEAENGNQSAGEDTGAQGPAIDDGEGEE